MLVNNPPRDSVRLQITFSRSYTEAAGARNPASAPGYYKEFMCPSCTAGYYNADGCERYNEANDAWDSGDLDWLDSQGFEVYDSEDPYESEKRSTARGELGVYGWGRLNRLKAYREAHPLKQKATP